MPESQPRNLRVAREISRSDFGIEFNMPLEGGGVVVGDKVSINLEIEGILQG